MNEFKETVQFIFFGTIAIIVAVTILISLFYPMAKKQCHERWSKSNYNTEFGFFKGCLIQLEDGSYVPQEALINIKE